MREDDLIEIRARFSEYRDAIAVVWSFEFFPNRAAVIRVGRRDQTAFIEIQLVGVEFIRAGSWMNIGRLCIETDCDSEDGLIVHDVDGVFRMDARSISCEQHRGTFREPRFTDDDLELTEALVLDAGGGLGTRLPDVRPGVIWHLSERESALVDPNIAAQTQDDRLLTTGFDGDRWKQLEALDAGSGIRGLLWAFGRHQGAVGILRFARFEGDGCIELRCGTATEVECRIPFKVQRLEVLMLAEVAPSIVIRDSSSCFWMRVSRLDLAIRNGLIDDSDPPRTGQ